MKQDASPTRENDTISLREAFKTLRILSNQQLISGTDNWRHPTGSDHLATIDPALSQLVQKQPPSKFGHSEKPSLWTAAHFYLALPTLSYAINKYGKEDETTRRIVLSRKDIEKYFVAFPYVIKHYHEYVAFVDSYGVPSSEGWNNILRSSVRETTNGSSAATQLATLPPYFREKALRVLSGQEDSLVGRIVLGYMLGQGTRPEDISMDKRTAQYLAPIREGVPDKPLFERLIAAQQELGELEPFLHSYSKNQSLTLDEFLGLVSWYARPHLVEMIIPGLTGAADPAIQALIALFDQIVRDGSPDYTHPKTSALPSIKRLRETQSLESIGRLSIVKDILGGTSESPDSEGQTIRQLISNIYSESERQAAWGNLEYYVPDMRRPSGFETFRQDIANILYCAGLFAETNNMSGTVKPESIKKLAATIKIAGSMGEIRRLMHTHRGVLNNLAIDWEIRFAGHERLRLLRFVRQTFGLETIKPIPIAIRELNKGFADSSFDGRVYHLRYQEAGEKLEMAITMHTTERQPKQVKYCTSPAFARPRLTPDGLPYSAWLEVFNATDTSDRIIVPVPGRGSYDPFGRVGSPHGGEVVGFGCSVHHASLAVILAELASLGASIGDLEQVAASFMHINKQLHERHDLAAFQLAQIIAAFDKDKTSTIRDYLRQRKELIPDPSRPHLAAYIRIGEKSLAWAEPQAARLSFGYPKLYPLSERVILSPRYSWYDGTAVELPEATVHWQVLTC